MEETGLEVLPEMLVEGDHTMEAGMDATSALVSLEKRATAVVFSNDLTAIGVMRKAFDLSLDIPQDLSIVGFDDIRLAQFTTPPLTTVQMSQVGIATLAFRALLDSVEPAPNENAVEAHVIETNLVLRCSTSLARDRRPVAK